MALAADCWVDVLAFLSRVQLFRVQCTNRLLAALLQRHFPERPYARVLLEIWAEEEEDTEHGGSLATDTDDSGGQLMAGLAILDNNNVDNCADDTTTTMQLSSMWKFFCPDVETENQFPPDADEAKWFDDARACCSTWQRIVCVHERGLECSSSCSSRPLHHLITDDETGVAMTTNTVWRLGGGSSTNGGGAAMLEQKEWPDLYMDRGIWMRQFVHGDANEADHHAALSLAHRRAEHYRNVARNCCTDTEEMDIRLSSFDATRYTTEPWQLLRIDLATRSGMATLQRRLDLPFVRVRSAHICCGWQQIAKSRRLPHASLLEIQTCTVLRRLFSPHFYRNTTVHKLFSSAHIAADAPTLLGTLRACEKHFGQRQQDQLLARVAGCCATFQMQSIDSHEDTQLCPGAVLQHSTRLQLKFAQGNHNLTAHNLAALLHMYNPEQNPERSIEFSAEGDAYINLFVEQPEFVVALIAQLAQHFLAARSTSSKRTYSWRFKLRFFEAMPLLPPRSSSSSTRTCCRLSRSYNWRDVRALSSVYVPESLLTVAHTQRLELNEQLFTDIHLHNRHSDEHWRMTFRPAGAAASFAGRQAGGFEGIPVNEWTRFSLVTCEWTIWRYANRQEALHTRLSEEAHQVAAWWHRCAQFERAIGNGEFSPLLFWGPDTTMHVVDDRKQITQQWTDYAVSVWLLGWAQFEG